MTQLTKLLDGMAWLCVALLFSKYAIHWANLMFDWHLRWYFLENIPYLALILFILMFIFAIPSEMIKDKQKEKHENSYEALKNKLDHVICGDEKTKQEAKENRTTPEAVKAARHAQKAKPQ